MPNDEIALLRALNKLQVFRFDPDRLRVRVPDLRIVVPIAIPQLRIVGEALEHTVLLALSGDTPMGLAEVWISSHREKQNRDDLRPAQDLGCHATPNSLTWEHIDIIDRMDVHRGDNIIIEEAYGNPVDTI